MPETEPPRDFPELYDRYFDRVCGYVRCRVAAAAEADDVVGRVFERALERFDTYDPARGTVEVWLFAVARNAVHDHYRSPWRRASAPLDALGEVAASDLGAHERLQAAEDRRLLAEALAALDERTRDILGLKFQGRLTNRAIAEILGLGESHVGVLVHRAVRELHAKLSQEARP